jgi:hypothetical protein
MAFNLFVEVFVLFVVFYTGKSREVGPIVYLL